MIGGNQGNLNAGSLTNSGSTLQSGRDTTLCGAQVSGDSVKMDVGRDLTLSSQQDSGRYDAKQASVSGGVSVPMQPRWQRAAVTS